MNTQKGCPTMFFGTRTQKSFFGKSLFSALRHKIFDTREFLKHKIVPLRKDSVLRDPTILRKRRDTRPSLLSLKYFDTTIFFGTKRGSSTKFFGTVRQKFLRENLAKSLPHPPSLISIKIVDTGNVVKDRNATVRSVWYCETTSFL